MYDSFDNTYQVCCTVYLADLKLLICVNSCYGYRMYDVKIMNSFYTGILKVKICMMTLLAETEEA